MYKFSPSSTPLLERCVELAKRNVETNPWKERFVVTMPSIVSDHSEETQGDLESIEQMEVNLNQTDTDTDNIYKEIEADPLLNINMMFEDSMADKLLIKLAQNIDDASAEKLFNQIMTRNINLKHIDSFFKYFLPNYFKQHQSWLCLDVMINAYKVYPAQFHILLINIVNYEITANILQEFVSTLRPSEQSEILQMIIASNISTNAFIKHIFTIHACYKTCIGVETIDNFIFLKLKEASEDCILDKQYGRLLLTFLQNKSHDNNTHLRKIVELHRSPFRRPCINILNNFSAT